MVRPLKTPVHIKTIADVGGKNYLPNSLTKTLQ
jgi:hypothetical protein